MKRNLLYLAGIALFATGLFSGCNEDAPSYANLAVDAEALAINLDEAAEESFRIVDGNGGYKVTSSDTKVATAAISGDEVIVTGLQYGTAIVTVTDWAKKSANVKVVVDQELDLIMKTVATTMFPSESKTLEVYTGNRGYSITSSSEAVATAKISEDGKVDITSIAPGTATLTVKDKRNKTAEITVKVIKKLVVDNSEDITYLITDKPVTIKILDGNGDYTCSLPNYSSSYIKCTVEENGTEVIIEGLKRNYFNKAITIKDKEGQSIDIHIKTIDEPYLENPSYRYLIAGSFAYQSLSTSKVGEAIYSKELNISLLTIKGTGSYAAGFAVQFTGNLEEGAKTNAVLYKVAKNAIDKNVAYPIEDCKIDKIKDGWYWVSFLEPGYTVRSYFITKQ